MAAVKMEQWALFPLPIVFTHESYLHEHTIIQHLADGTVVRYAQPQIMDFAYSLPNRLRGVYLWHFLKGSAEMTEEKIKPFLLAHFCHSLDMNQVKRVDAVELAIKTSVSFRVVTQSCPQ